MFYSYFSVLSPFQRFIPISAFYLSPFQRFIPISALYPHISVVSPFQHFIPILAFYPYFSFRFQFLFPPFSFSVVYRPPTPFDIYFYPLGLEISLAMYKLNRKYPKIRSSQSISYNCPKYYTP